MDWHWTNVYESLWLQSIRLSPDNKPWSYRCKSHCILSTNDAPNYSLLAYSSSAHSIITTDALAWAINSSSLFEATTMSTNWGVDKRSSACFDTSFWNGLDPSLKIVYTSVRNTQRVYQTWFDKKNFFNFLVNVVYTALRLVIRYYAT